MLKALRFEILRAVPSTCQKAVSLPEKPVRVATLINESDFLIDNVLRHNKNVFLEDSLHDWAWSDGTGAGLFRYYSRVAEIADVLVVYEVDTKFTPTPIGNFDTLTGKPVTP